LVLFLDEKSSQFEEKQVQFWFGELTTRLSFHLENAPEECPNCQAVLDELMLA
jgi:hypothetical protein